MGGTCPVCNNSLEDGLTACPYCGFRILGSTQSFQPIKIDVRSEYEKPKKPMQKHQLSVIRGPQTGMEITLKEGRSSVGRDPQCDVFLNDMTVSRSHAMIEINSKGCVIRDMNSFNGIWVNDRMVDVCLLKTGDVLQIGAFCLVYKERQ